MERIPYFIGAPQPKRPTPAARPEADVTDPYSALPVDIGHYVGNSKLTDRERLTILDNAWTPANDFGWQRTESIASGKLRRKYLSRQHISWAY
ncbi:hypothetical protein LSAT2_022541, partial [Lamellibrachia satsuma]